MPLSAHSCAEPFLLRIGCETHFRYVRRAPRLGNQPNHTAICQSLSWGGSALPTLARCTSSAMRAMPARRKGGGVHRAADRWTPGAVPVEGSDLATTDSGGLCYGRRRKNAGLHCKTFRARSGCTQINARALEAERLWGIGPRDSMQSRSRRISVGGRRSIALDRKLGERRHTNRHVFRWRRAFFLRLPQRTSRNDRF